jgi:hypothetical protein
MVVRSSLAAGAALAMIGSVSVGALAEGNSSRVGLWNNTGAFQVDGSHSTLERHEDGVHMSVHAVGLPAERPATVRWVIFNNPAACTTGNPAVSKCGPADVLNTAVAGSMATGPVTMVTPDGVANLHGKLDANSTANVFMGGGLTNPGGAEIQLLVRVQVETPAGLKWRTFQFAVHEPDSGVR